MKLGWIDLGDGAGISASWDGEELSLAGSVGGGGLSSGLGPRTQIGSLQIGALLPLVAGPGNMERPELNGLYRVLESGFDFEPSIPWSLKLQRVVVGSISGETTVIGAMLPTVAPVVLGTTSPRVGIPGNPEAGGPGTYLDPPDQVTDLAEGRVYTLAVLRDAQRWISWSCAPSEFLAGSPRVQFKADGIWWTVHGQPPPGVPVRVHNGRVGIQLQAGGETPKLLVVATNGTVSEYPIVLNDFESGPGFWAWSDPAGVEVVRADSEMVWLRFVQRRSIGATRNANGVTTNVQIRRGMPGLTVSHTVRASIELLAPVTRIGTLTDTTTNIVTLETSIGFIQAQRVALISGSIPRIRDLETWRFEVGSAYRTRPFVDPSVQVYR